MRSLWRTRRQLILLLVSCALFFFTLYVVWNQSPHPHSRQQVDSRGKGGSFGIIASTASQVYGTLVAKGVMKAAEEDDVHVPGRAKAAIARQRFQWQYRHFQEFVSSLPDDHQVTMAFFWHQFVPVADCEIRERIGTMGDGGKWLCNPHLIGSGNASSGSCSSSGSSSNNSGGSSSSSSSSCSSAVCRVYSFGAEDDISFEESMSRAPFHCETDTFDPTISKTSLEGRLRPGMRLHSVGLGPSDPDMKKFTLDWDGEECQLKSLAQITQENGHSTVDILKIDIEESEMYALPYMLTRESEQFKRLRVKQILVELHIWGEELQLQHLQKLPIARLKQVASLFKLLADHGFYMFGMEANPFDVRCYEFAFVHESQL